MDPSLDELRLIEPWLAGQDGNPNWPTHVHETLLDLARRLGRGL